MRRVLVIGPCGAGKSTLAFKLAERTGLPLHHMDKLNWLPGWVDGGNDRVRAGLEPGGLALSASGFLSREVSRISSTIVSIHFRRAA